MKNVKNAPVQNRINRNKVAKTADEIIAKPAGKEGVKRKPTRRENAEDLLNIFAIAKQRKEQAAAEMKETEEKLREWAIDNRDEFEGKGTLTLEGGKLCFTNQNAVKTDESFDIELFSTVFPQAVDKKPKLSVVKSLLLSSDAAKVEKLGVTLTTDEIFSVKVA